MRGIAYGMWIALLKLALSMLLARLIGERLQQMVARLIVLFQW